MAIVIPGVVGRPIRANNFTQRMRKNPRLVAWHTFTRPAYFKDGNTSGLVPRKGRLSMRLSAGDPVWDDAGWVSIPKGATGHWEVSDQYVNPQSWGITCIFTATDGYTEPMALRFSNGDVVYVNPNHAGATGVAYRKSGTDLPRLVMGDSLSLNEPHVLNLAFNHLTREIRWQADAGEIFSATASSEWDTLATVPSVNLLAGRALTNQWFQGSMHDLALWSGPLLDTRADYQLANEYFLAVHGG